MIASFGAVISIAGNWLLIPVWGYYASAWMYLLCAFLMICITWHLGRRHYYIPYPLKRIALYVCIALGLYFVGHFTKIEHLALNLLKNTVLFAIFVVYVIRKEKILQQI